MPGDVPTRQATAEDEFRAAPRGLKRVSRGIGRRVRTLLLGRPAAPRRSIQEAFDWIAGAFAALGDEQRREVFSRCDLRDLAQRVAGLYEQPGAFGNWGAPSHGNMEDQAGCAEIFGQSHRRQGERIENVPSHVLAADAIVAFRDHGANDRAIGDGVMEDLRRRQRPAGEIAPFGMATTLATADAEAADSHSLSDDSLPSFRATLAFLEAAWWQAKSAFDESAWEFPAEIDERDERARCVLSWSANLPPQARLLDAGCGKGRYLKLLRRARPDLQLVGCDLSQRALAELPADVEPRRGGLLRIPAGTGEFDGVLCIEALEHGLLPRQAVTELCRVVRPAGKVLIIDKHRRFQSLSTTQPWETWFEPDEVCRWLSEFCDEVNSREVSHGPRLRPRLFLAWTGTRRASPS